MRIGIQENPQFSYANGRLVWEELRFDKRYQKRSFNVINLYTISTKKYKQITHKSRLFSPALSPDGKLIIAVDISLQNKIELAEFDAETGQETNRFLNPLNLTLQSPQYDETGEKIVVVGVNKDGETLCEINRKSGVFKQLFAFQRQQITRPFYAGSRIVFSAHYNGLNNIYSLDPASGKIVQHTSAKYGAFNPSYNNFSKKVLFNNYEYRGYDVSEFQISDDTSIPIEKLTNTFVNYSAPLSQQEGNVNVFDSIPTVNYKSSAYSEFKNLINFHSVIPIAESDDQTDRYNLGFKFLSNNKLNTLDAYMGYQYNQGLKKSEYFGGLTYKKFYPVLTLEFADRANLNYVTTLVQNKKVVNAVEWRERFTEFSATLPFIFNQRNNTYNSSFKISSSYTSRYDFENPNPKIANSIRFPLKYQFSFSRATTRSARDLAPRWAQSLNASYQHLPFESKINGELFVFKTQLFTPGLFLNHSLQAGFNYQSNSGTFSNSVNIPQVNGYSTVKRPKAVYNTLLVKYRLPLLYPDLEIGPLAYIKRLKGGIFADFENIENIKAKPITYGLELKADMNLLRFYLPNFELGGKLIFINNNASQNPIFELGFNYNY